MTQMQLVPLSTDERGGVADELARLHRELEAIKQEKKDTMRDLKDRTDACEDKIAALCTMLERGKYISAAIDREVAALEAVAATILPPGDDAPVGTDAVDWDSLTDAQRDEIRRAHRPADSYEYTKAMEDKYDAQKEDPGDQDEVSF